MKLLFADELLRLRNLMTPGGHPMSVATRVIAMTGRIRSLAGPGHGCRKSFCTWLQVQPLRRVLPILDRTWASSIRYQPGTSGIRTGMNTSVGSQSFRCLWVCRLRFFFGGLTTPTVNSFGKRRYGGLGWTHPPQFPTYCSPRGRTRSPSEKLPHQSNIPQSTSGPVIYLRRKTFGS